MKDVLQTFKLGVVTLSLGIRNVYMFEKIGLTKYRTTCPGYIRANFHGSHVPCGTKWTEETGTNYPCREAVTDFFTNTSPDTWVLFPSSNADKAKVQLGSYAYFSFSRDSLSDYAQQCTFDITVTMTTCLDSQYCRLSSPSACDCVPFHTLTLPYATNWVANDTFTEADFRVWIPERAGRVSLKINNTEFSTYAYVS